MAAGSVERSSKAEARDSAALKASLTEACRAVFEQ